MDHYNAEKFSASVTSTPRQGNTVIPHDTRATKINVADMAE